MERLLTELKRRQIKFPDVLVKQLIYGDGLLWNKEGFGLEFISQQLIKRGKKLFQGIGAEELFPSRGYDEFLAECFTRLKG
jgi:hypothetical protein